MIATSHLRGDMAAARLHAGLGFVPWDIAYAAMGVEKVYLHLP